ncbi:MAG: TonB-dependent receptor [Candidatus Eremiobacteraeota bacterium]|nr:TonB-dependent receptor [Candidatus Eremiobacteraeota bacterium]
MLALIATMFTPQGALAQATGTAIAGRILDARQGLPVGGAQVHLLNATSTVDTTTTGSDGSFTFKNVAPGSYTFEISAQGYQTSRTPPLPVVAGQAVVEFQTAITPVATGLREIATVSVSQQRALQTTATINESLAPSVILDQNYIRAGDALATLPFVASSTSSSLGDDESIRIRGFDPTEAATFLDGHPLGPIGVKSGNSYDYQVAQFWGYSNINVVYGSGATGLYGIPTLAGAVDFQTLNPTPQTHLTLTQGYGSYSKLMSGASLTGTSGPLGFALSYGVQGSNGELGPANILQSGLLNGGQSRCPNSPSFTAYEPLVTAGTNASLPPSLMAGDAAACSYLLSGYYLNRNALAKLTYQFGPQTSLLVTAYNANMYASSPGNGDTDFQTQPFELAGANGIIGAGTNNFTLTNGTMTACSAATIAALNDSPAGYTCLTPAQYASDFSGPAGGGPGREHFAMNQDYHARLSQGIGPGTLILDGFIDNYNFNNIKGPLPSPFFNDIYFTHGALLSYQLAGTTNSAAVGVYFQHQIHFSNGGDAAPIIGAPFNGFGITDTNYFINDQWTPSSHVSVFADLGVDRSLNTATTNIDPRLAFVFRPNTDDVFRLAAGRSTGDPDPQIVFGGFSFGALPSFNPAQNCTNPIVSIGSGNSPFIQPEQANDLEFSAAHRFSNQATFEVDAYNSVEINPILSAVFPLSIVPGSQLPSAATLAGFTGALNGACGGRVFTNADLGVSAPFNAGAGYFRGINMTTKVPLTQQFELNAGYLMQVAYYAGLSNAVLQSNLGLINGQQLGSVPNHQANLGFGYNNKASQLTARLDTYYVGAPNGFDRPPYWYSNMNIAKTFGHITFNLGINNLFNDNASQYGLIGYGVPFPVNQFAAGPQTSIAQGAEEYGLPLRQIWLTTTYRM